MVVSQSGSSGNPYRFAGAWRYRDDGDAGLLHVGARYYDPQVGRFISRDPVLSEHPYLYCQHEPVNRVDPSGHLPKWLEEKWEQVKEGAKKVWEWYERAEYAAELIDLWSKWYQSVVDMETSNSMRKMIRSWNPDDDIDPSAWYNAWLEHLRQGVQHTDETAGDTARFYYNHFYPPKAPW